MQEIRRLWRPQAKLNGCLIMADCVEEVRDCGGLIELSIIDALTEWLSCGVQAGYRDQLCEFSKVLGGGCEQELVARTGGSAETKPIEFEDTLEVGEQHLDLLA
jgi:hypothetical protein